MEQQFQAYTNLFQGDKNCCTQVANFLLGEQEVDNPYPPCFPTKRCLKEHEVPYLNAYLPFVIAHVF